MNEELSTLLSQVDRIKNSENAQGIFNEIAEGLFGNYHIEQGNIEYKFLEVEFYYFSENHKDTKTDGTPFVYKRYCDKAGCFFIHQSGLDICFKTIMEGDEPISYGGILIRSLLRIDKSTDSHTVVSRPWACMDALFNYTDSGTFPRIVENTKTDTNVKLEAALRYNAGASRLNKPYCLYDSQFHEDKYNWTYKGEKLPEYDPVTREANNITAPRPWNRKPIEP